MIVYGERLTHGTRGGHAARALLNVAGRVVSADHEGSGPARAAGRHERPRPARGRHAAQRRAGRRAGQPGRPRQRRDRRDRRRRRPRARCTSCTSTRCATCPAGARGARRSSRPTRSSRTPTSSARGCGSSPTSSSRPSPTPRRRARSRIPTGACSACARRSRGPTRCAPSGTSLADLAARLGHDLGDPERPDGLGEALRGGPVLRRPDARRARRARRALDRAPGRGAAGRRPTPARSASRSPPHAPTPNGALRLGTFRSIWAAPEVELSPALKFLRHDQRAELYPVDAERLGIAPRRARRRSAPTARSVNATAVLRTAVPEGSVFLEEGIAADSASELDGGGLVEVAPQ